MSDQPASPPSSPRPKSGASKKRTLLAEQELRLLSTLVLLLGIGLFLALPFVLSIGSVVFLPVTSAIILSVLLAPLADRLSSWGVPNMLASVLALLTFVAIVVLARRELHQALQACLALPEQQMADELGLAMSNA